jgi:hypothetical protein
MFHTECDDGIFVIVGKQRSCFYYFFVCLSVPGFYTPGLVHFVIAKMENSYGSSLLYRWSEETRERERSHRKKK